MSQLEESLCGSSGSRRSERPRACCTETPVAATPRSTRQLTAGQSQPSPSSARVLTSTPWSPRTSTRVASSTHVRGTHSAPDEPSEDQLAVGLGAPLGQLEAALGLAPELRRAARRRGRGCSAARARRPAAPAAARSAGRRPARRRRGGRCPPRDRARRSARRRGAPGPARRRTARARAARPPRASISAASTSTSPSAFACEPVSSRSTSEAPRRIPRRVSWKPSSRSAAATAS